MKAKQVVVIGGGVAGRAFAVAASRFPHLSVTIIDPASQPIFESLSFDIRPHERPLSPQLLPHTHWQKGRVVGIDVKTGQVILADRQIPFDFVVLATGSDPNLTGVSGAPAVAVSPWRAEGRAQVVMSTQAAFGLVQRGVRSHIRVVVVGGGRVGVAVTGHLLDHARLIGAPLAVTLFEQRPRLLAGLPMRTAQNAEQALVKQGVTVYCGSKVVGISGHRECETEESVFTPFDVCVWAASHSPVQIPVLADGNPVGFAGGPTDSRLRVRPYAHVYALGDAAMPPIVHRGPDAAYIFEEALFLSEGIARAALNRPSPAFVPRSQTQEQVYVGGGMFIATIGHLD